MGTGVVYARCMDEGSALPALNVGLRDAKLRSGAEFACYRSIFL